MFVDNASYDSFIDWVNGGPDSLWDEYIVMERNAMILLRTGLFFVALGVALGLAGIALAGPPKPSPRTYAPIQPDQPYYSPPQQPQTERPPPGSLGPD